MLNSETEATKEMLDFLSSTTNLDRIALDELLETATQKSSMQGLAIRPDVFVAVISAIYAKGYTISKAIVPGDMTDSYKFPGESAKSKDDEFLLVCSRMNSTKKESKSPMNRKSSRSSDSDFEVDIDREQKAVYDVIIDQNRKKSKDGQEDTILKKQAEQAKKRSRRLSYEEYINEGGSFDHLLLSADESFYRVVFLKVEVFKPTDELGEFFSCKAGPSSLVFLDSKFYSI